MSKFIIFAMLSLTLCKASDELLKILPKNTAAITVLQAKSAVDTLWARSFSRRTEGTAIQKLTTGFRELIEKTTDEAKKASASCAYLMWFTGRTHGFSTEKSKDIDLQSQLGTMQLIARNVAQSMVDTNGFSEEVAAQYVLENMFKVPFSSEAQHAKQTTYQDQTICTEVFKSLLHDMGLPTPKIIPNAFEGKLSLRDIWEQTVNFEGPTKTLTEIMQSPQRTRLNAACDSLTATVNRLTEELEKVRQAQKAKENRLQELEGELKTARSQVAQSQQATPARDSRCEDQAISPCTKEQYDALLKELENYKKAQEALEELKKQADASQTPRRDEGVQATGALTAPSTPTVRLDFGDGSSDDDGNDAVKLATSKKSQDGSNVSRGSGQPSQSLKGDQGSSNERRAEQASHEPTQKSSGTPNPDSDTAAQKPPTTPRNNDSTSGVEKIASQVPTAQERTSGNSVMNNNFSTPVRGIITQTLNSLSPSNLIHFLGYSVKNLLTVPAGDAIVS